MSNAFITRLDRTSELGNADRVRLEDLFAEPLQASAGADLIRENERPEHVHFVLEGYAYRYKMLSDGSLSIMALLIPGDLCDMHVAILGKMDHSIAAMTDCRLVRVARDDLLKLIEDHPRLNRALWWATLVDEAILREWIVGLGHRSAESRFAHLICELHRRFESIDRIDDGGFPFPLTQEQIGSVLGITSVYANRIVQRFRRNGLITLEGRWLRVEPLGALEDHGDFDANYLHLEGPVLN